MPLTEPTKLVLRRTALTGWAMTIDTTRRAAPDNDYFTILTTGAVNYNVDWGDGTSEANVTSNSKVHTYATPGVYSVKIFANTGSTFRPYYNNAAEGDKIITLEDSFLSFPFGTSLLNAFYGSGNITSVSRYLDVSGVTSFSNAWDNCTSLTSFPLLDTSSGTNFSYAWYNCTSLTSFPANFFDAWAATPANNCFVNAWDRCFSLTATSVENILNSIDTSGRSAPASGVDITIDYNASSGTPNVSTAVTNLKSRGWTITLNGVAQ